MGLTIEATKSLTRPGGDDPSRSQLNVELRP